MDYTRQIEQAESIDDLKAVLREMNKQLLRDVPKETSADFIFRNDKTGPVLKAPNGMYYRIELEGVSDVSLAVTELGKVV